MTTVREVFGLEPTKGQVGIEIEVEGIDLPGTHTPTTRFSRAWNITQDGSLRGESYEYVLKKPLSLKDAEAALQELEKSYKKCKSVVNDSVRAGVHIHINCQELSISQLMTFATVYYSIEELLLMFCNSSRRGNHFCLRAKDAEYQIYLVQKALQARSRSCLSSSNIRYSSINFTSLGKFGSLEFRSLEGTSDLGKVYTWAKILHDLMENSKQFSNPIEAVESMSQDGYESYLRQVLGDNYQHFEDIPNVDGLVLDSTRQAQSLAYGIDWGTVGEGWVSGRRAPKPRGAEQHSLVLDIEADLNTPRAAPIPPDEARASTPNRYTGLEGNGWITTRIIEDEEVSVPDDGEYEDDWFQGELV